MMINDGNFFCFLISFINNFRKQFTGVGDEDLITTILPSSFLQGKKQIDWLFIYLFFNHFIFN